MKSVDRLERPTARLNRGGCPPGALLLIVTVIALSLSVVQSRADNAERRILILSAFNYTLPAASQAINGIEARLREAGGQEFAIDAEFLDLFRVTDPAHEMRMAAFVREKYAARPPRAVIVLGSAALQFIMKHPDIVAPQIPVVFAGVSPATYANLRPPSNVTGVFSS
ncbi:hypothetical protein [Bradyrhizobium japonicum]|uniref:hypothetical protein n=1 Tax=Bradyrhizobium japonicum TaxID=375 RepID=UPI001181C549|nr:hypothetical protein [Bradyrhizobium japonicum]